MKEIRIKDAIIGLGKDKDNLFGSVQYERPAKTNTIVTVQTELTRKGELAMEKNKDIKLNAPIENVFKVSPKVKKLAISEPELGSYLTQLSKNLDDATNSICEAYGILDLLENKMSIGGNYKDDMTSEADSIRAVLKIITASMGKVSDTADLMSYTTFKEN